VIEDLGGGPLAFVVHVDEDPAVLESFECRGPCLKGLVASLDTVSGKIVHLGGGVEKEYRLSQSEQTKKEI
jgi:hypothetical protein